jgi:hypothetical protein
MINADVIDLYSRVTVGTKIIVLADHRDVARATGPVRLVAPRAADLRTTGIY